MQQSDKGRFVVMLEWLCKRYGRDGKALALPVGEDFNDYFSALKDLQIRDVEQGAKWHYAHSEFYPNQPAALRRSVEGWRSEQPKQSGSHAASLPDWIGQIDQTEAEVDTSFSAMMSNLLDQLIAGKITSDEHMRQLKLICDDAGMKYP